MSIASTTSGFTSETESPYDVDGPWGSGRGGGFGSGGGGGDRMPPQDNDAEQSVLGAMLLSKDAIADVVESVRGGDFYRPAHETIYDAMVDLYGRGEPVDPITTTAELQRRGELARVGGAPYLHTLSAGVPIAANAAYYAEIVREKAILRRLVDAGTRIAQMGYAGEGKVDDVVDRAQAEVYSVTDKRSSEDYAPLSAIMESALDEIEAINNHGGEMVGVPTGFADLDELTNGLHPGQMVIIAARPAMGKALALDTPLPTPTGWTTMGQVRVGDRLYDGQGRPTRVLAATDAMVGRPCSEVAFSDGSTIVADGRHQWLTRRLMSVTTRPSVVTTEQLAVTIGAGHLVALPSGDEVKVIGVHRMDSVPVRCVQVDDDRHLYLAGPTGIPTHNSTLGLDFCRAASIHHNMSSVIFSLEMTRNEITMRLLSAEAKIPLNHMRNGNMNDDDWTRLARRMGEVSSSPLFIDDSPNMTMMEIRAKARRLKQRHDLRLIVIDYMQLMTSGKKVESRQLEVSEFSRQIKLLAKELEIPVVALSQLNRGPEQRSDKRPMMSDLRESGCLAPGTRLMRADTNAEITLGELMESRARDIPVWTLDDRLKLVPRTLTHAFPSGTRQVYELTLGSGRRIRATANHKFLTYDGWVPLAELGPGIRLGCPRHVPPPLQIAARDDREIAAVAHRLGDGPRGRCSRDTSVPDWVFSLPRRQLRQFVRSLWATDGTVQPNPDGSGTVAYAATSRRLADDVARLLLRFSVVARISTARMPGHSGGAHLHVTGAADQLRFLEDIGGHGARSAIAGELTARLRATRANTRVDTVGCQVWDRVRDVLRDERIPGRELAAAAGTKVPGSAFGDRSPDRQRLGRVASILGGCDLELSATNDVSWDSVSRVDAVGAEPVYDATVLGTHNFVANGIATHNSLEQDADMVVLLHREDVYERESARPGEADLIVAKHRNGPTRDITVAFQGHYSRFVDMAHG